MSERDEAEKLTRFLLERDRYATGSPLEQRVQRGISTMADQIAQEVIAENPQLREVIRARVEELVTKALREDEVLNKVVVRAVAEGLGQLVAERHQDEGD